MKEEDYIKFYERIKNIKEESDYEFDENFKAKCKEGYEGDDYILTTIDKYDDIKDILYKIVKSRSEFCDFIGWYEIRMYEKNEEISYKDFIFYLTILTDWYEYSENSQKLKNSYNILSIMKKCRDIKWLNYKGIWHKLNNEDIKKEIINIVSTKEYNITSFYEFINMFDVGIYSINILEPSYSKDNELNIFLLYGYLGVLYNEILQEIKKNREYELTSNKLSMMKIIKIIENTLNFIEYKEQLEGINFLYNFCERYNILESLLNIDETNFSLFFENNFKKIFIKVIDIFDILEDNLKIIVLFVIGLFIKEVIYEFYYFLINFIYTKN